MKKTKLAFLHSVLALLLCVSMLVGTTFAWFTDGVTSGKNRIVAGNLDVELYYMNDETSTWQPVGKNTNVFKQGTLWEPGHTEVVKLKVVNAGTLALKYQLGIYVASEVQGTNMAGETFKLSDYIKYGVVEGDQNYDRKAAVAAVNGSAKKLNEAYAKPGTLNSGEAVFTVVVYMPESVDNVANYRGDAIPKIELGIQLAATQLANELDSFGDDYDAGATYPPVKIDFSTTQPVPAEKVDDTGALVEAMTVGNQDGIRAEVPAGALLVPGADDLGLVLESKEESEANLNLKDGQSANPLDIKMPNLDPNNTQLIKVTIPGLMRKGLNSTSVEMYHVENGVTVAMKLEASLADLDAHNEFYYDPATGDVTICTKSFSEYVAVTVDENPWDGESEAEYAIEDGVIVIYNAQQLAYFRSQVDNGNNFAGQTVMLGHDIYLESYDENGNRLSFNPIGWGYANESYNSGDAAGKTFNGIFDGNYKTIYGLYQNGWDLESATGEKYSYTNCGMGLFASVCGATIKNLTISGANIVAECVEMGVLAGLSQGTCNFIGINIYGCKIANYQKATGGVVGEVSPYNGASEHNFTDINIDSTTVVGSLWGDFDCPVGGVIGARWDDSNVTKVNMTNVNVACRLDVYNDVTSSYQWYAYRRAGMLIGNTDTPPADGKNSKVATADFLTCTDVTVYYGDWVHYTYCEFNNYNPSWPFVRVQEGENCSAYSNPRYGVPNDPVTGQPVTSLDHNHTNGDDHNIEITFNQLYGGGQGVYGGGQGMEVGSNPIEGVTIGAYTITYINNGEVLAVDYIKDNTNEVTLEDTNAESEAQAALTAQGLGDGYALNYWMTITSVRTDRIEANNQTNVVLYPSFVGVHTAIFVDQEGNILYWEIFKEGATSLNAPTEVPAVKDCAFHDEWMILTFNEDGTLKSSTAYSADALSEVTYDITLYPIYTYEGDVNLIPVDNNGDGITDEYQVGGYSKPEGQALVEIPASVNGIEVTGINAEAFSSYSGVHAIVIPTTVTNIGAYAIAEKLGNFDAGETITIYYEGSYQEWIEKEAKFDANWEGGVSASSRIFFLNGTGKVDPNEGYLQAVREYGGYGALSWELKEVTTELKTEYTGECDCAVSTTGDIAHIYVDANGNVMGRNEDGTPVNSSGDLISYGVIKEGEYFWESDEYGLTDGTVTTYKRYRPDKAYWEDVTANG